MSSHSSNLILIGMRSISRIQTSSRTPNLPSWVPMVTLVPKRTYQRDSMCAVPGQTQQTKSELVSPAARLTQRNLSALAGSLRSQCRPLSRYDFLDLDEVEDNTQKVLACRSMRHFIVDRGLAQLVTDYLESDLEDRNATIFECNPGPGVLTRALLNSGARRVVALESDKAFLPDLQALEDKVDGQLDVVHCDFFKLDPIGLGTMKPPSMYSDKLFNNLHISAVPWTAGVPVKVVGIFPQSKERNMIWKLLYALFEQSSVFRYGRVQLMMFVSEKEYLKLVAQPGDMKTYQAVGVLAQIACDIELLHKEPWTSFVSRSKRSPVQKSKQLPNDHLCLVRMTPRQSLFTGSLTPANGSTLIMMVKQCMAKKRARLINQLNSWSPESGEKVLNELGLLEDIKTGNVFPEEYKLLFERLDQSKEFTQSWLYGETLMDPEIAGII